MRGAESEERPLEGDVPISDAPTNLAAAESSRLETLRVKWPPRREGEAIGAWAEWASGSAGCATGSDGDGADLDLAEVFGALLSRAIAGEFEEGVFGGSLGAGEEEEVEEEEGRACGLVESASLPAPPGVQPPCEQPRCPAEPPLLSSSQVDRALGAVAAASYIASAIVDAESIQNSNSNRPRAD